MDFTPKCRSQLMKQQKRRLGDWRLDFNLRTSCEADVEKHCRVRSTRLPSETNYSVLHDRLLCWVSLYTSYEDVSLSTSCIYCNLASVCPFVLHGGCCLSITYV